MERADELSLSGLTQGSYNPERPALSAVKAPPRTPWPMLMPTTVASLALNLILLAAVTAGGHFVLERMRELRESSHSLLSQTENLTRQSNTLRTEVEQLRQSYLSQTSEDVLFLKILVMRPSIDPELARRIAKSVHRHASSYGRDPNLVLAIISVESFFNPQAVSNVGAQGLMQVMPHWKRVLAITDDLHDVDVSVRYGLQILGFYESMYKDLHMALTAYNRGPGPVDSALMRGNDPSNGYAAKILATYDRLKRMNVDARQ